MKRVTGIGGIFFSAKDPGKLQAWYKKHLGIDVQEWGGTAFRWTDENGTPVGGTTVWSVGDGSDFAPGNSSFMVNYRVEDLHELLKVLRAEGCTDSKRCRTCSAHAAAHKARSRWSESVSVPRGG
jgi:hypothetical protein